jgi:hypothetical protein
MKLQTRTKAGEGDVAAPSPTRADGPIAGVAASDLAILVRPFVRRGDGRRM